MSSAAKIGALMIVILAILGFFVLKIEDIDLGSGGSRTVKVAFKDVAGLDAKSAVRVAGVRKGKVTDISVENGRAVVTLDVDKDIQIHRNATARIANLGLLGEKYVELDPGTADQPVVQSEEIVLAPGAQPASIDDVTTQVSEIAKDVKAVTESLRSVMAGPAGQQRLEDIVDNVRDITAQVRQLVAVNRSNVDATMVNMREITAQLRVEIPKLAASLDRAANQINGTVGENRDDVHRIVGNIKDLSSELRLTADNLNDITGKVKSGEGTVGKLFYSDEAHDKLTSALTSVEGGVTELKNTLARANRIGLELGIKGDYYPGRDSNPTTGQNGEAVDFGGNSRTTIGVKIKPNPDINRFYNIEVADDPQGKRHDKIVVETITDSQTGLSRTITTNQAKFDRDFLVSAQAGWVLDDLAVRIGLFDSTGGVGADYQYNKNLRVTGELFDFGERRDSNPHLRLFGEYTFYNETKKLPRLFVTSGLDNAFNDSQFIIGGGIRWKDDDLKYLLGSIPIGK